MFKLSDKVRVRSNGAEGVVSYVEDGYLCVELDNGAEMDFTDENKLQLVAEYEKEKIKAMIDSASKPRDLTGMFNAPYIPRRGDRALATKVILAIDNIAPEILYIAGRNNEGSLFAAMDDFDKVKYISELTGTPMVVFMGAAEMNDRELMKAVISKTLLVNISQRTDLVGDMLLAKCRQMIASYEQK